MNNLKCLIRYNNCTSLNELNNKSKIVCTLTTDELPTTIHKVSTLICDNSDITTLPLTLIKLQYLSIKYTFITNIPFSYVNLIYLDANESYHLNSISEYNTKLKVLKCNYTNITTIPDTLVNLEYIDCVRCKRLSKVPKQLNNLKHINCVGCKKLNYLPLSNIYEFINCCDTRITSIPSSPIKYLHCSCNFNNIPSLIKLVINDISITLSNLPNLKYLVCINCFVDLIDLPNLTELHLSNTAVLNNPTLTVHKVSLNYMYRSSIKFLNVKQLELYNSAFIANGLNKLISIKSYRSHLVLINLDKLTILELIKSDVIFTLSLNNIQSIITDKYTLKSIPRQYHKFIVDYH